MSKWKQMLGLTLAFVSICCGSESTAAFQDNEEAPKATESVSVIEVSHSGNENNYTFNVTVSSPDLGCNQYADWWEIIDLEGNLIYRRILAHSHVNEQPFTRSGGSVTISSNTQIYIRAHMNNTSYGSKVMKGSIGDGFKTANLEKDFAKELENQEPLPSGCAF